jgi:hypothetical protein
MKIIDKKETKELPYKNTNIEDMDGEIWVDALGLDGYYEVSNLGRIKSLSREIVVFGNRTRITKEKILKQTLHKTKDFLFTNCCANGKRQRFSIQRMIYKSFNTCKNIDELIVSHKNRCCRDNRLDNLIAETIQKNRIDNYYKYNYRIKRNMELLHEKHVKKHMLIIEKKCKICGTTKPAGEFIRISKSGIKKRMI